MQNKYKDFQTLFLFIVLWLSALCPMAIQAQDYMPKILSMQSRAKLINDWLYIRAKTVLPALMKHEDIDMWIIMSREYNEDPVIETMLPAEWMAARRRTILVMYQPKQGSLETLAIARYDVGKVFKRAWNPEKQPNQWKALADVIAQRNPQKIALNYSKEFGLADGVNWKEMEELKANLSAKFVKKIVSGERLAIGWLETRTPQEMAVYSQVMRIAHQIISEGFSEKVIQPGVTTTQDVQWWYRDRIAELKLQAWFHPSVDIQRNDANRNEQSRSFASKPGEEVIMPGDLIHVDFGITYLRLNTDTQQHAYILKPDETEAPKGLRDAFKVGMRLQDILTDQFKVGRTGNEVLKRALTQANQEGIEATIYTHPIGFHGHAAGPTIGLWDQQGGVPGKGDYPLHYNTAYSIELNAKVKIPEWNNKKIRVMLEEDGYFDKTGFQYIGGRQKQILLIPRPMRHLDVKKRK
ncbi:M24 family metallopeptidase [Microscilla marina]|uniref:Xaa-Pro aminopeptidase family enzyme n=1 Tax=Microscilla marina ATCC 23134 TaxID=313606 RepID=A1ZJD0_MICM2|nr:Xaa-Pro aminopeptidase family enzyme [Microscilla marina ATCC 23134]